MSLSISEMGKNYRAKYGHSPKDDFTLGVEVLKKEPAYFEQLDSSITRHIHEKIESLHPNDSGFLAKIRKWRAQNNAEYYATLSTQLSNYTLLREAEINARTVDNKARELDKVLTNQNELAEIARHHSIAHAKESAELTELTHRNTINALEAENERLFQATKRGMTPLAYDQYLLQVETKKALDAAEREHTQKIKVIEVEALYDVDDTPTRIRERNLERLNVAYAESYRIANDTSIPAPVRARQLAAQEAHIKKLEASVGLLGTEDS